MNNSTQQEGRLRWVKATERLPENTKEVFGKDEKGKKWTVFYTKGNEVAIDNLDEEEYEYAEYNENAGEERLVAGWYETCEQRSGIYDEIFLPRKIIEWLEELSSPLSEAELKAKFAEHLGEKELNTTDAYAIEFAVKNIS